MSTSPNRPTTLELARPDCKAGASPNIKVAITVAVMVKASTRQPVSRSRKMGSRAVLIMLRKAFPIRGAADSAVAAPAADSRKLSIRTCRTSRQREAPNDRRTANSCSLVVVRASIMFARLAQARSSTSATIHWRYVNGRLKDSLEARLASRGRFEIQLKLLEFCLVVRLIGRHRGLKDGGSKGLEMGPRRGLPHIGAQPGHHRQEPEHPTAELCRWSRTDWHGDIETTAHFDTEKFGRRYAENGTLRPPMGRVRDKAPGSPPNSRCQKP